MDNTPKRLATWWIKFEDLNWPNAEQHDRLRRRAAQYAEANVSHAILFGTHFRWDYLPYFTILHDYIAKVAEELHKYGIKLMDHHSVNLVHRYDTVEEMYNVMLNSGPHLPISPNREAAASWEYKGHKLNDWRIIDTVTREPLYYPQYAAEGFCHRNPEFIEAYTDYVKNLIRTTGIDGLSADDPMHYRRWHSCACPVCRAEFKRRTGMELPLWDDASFWGNWDNPAWNEWVDLRFDSTAVFNAALKKVLPEDFILTGCGTQSAVPKALNMGSDARKFAAGVNYINLEICGNTPPYKHDPMTMNLPAIDRLINSSHHLAVARENGFRCFGTTYAFVDETAKIAWALNKTIGSDCWLSTLKARLGLPDSILATLKTEPELAKIPFTYEKEHQELFAGEQIGQAAVYFSYETRNHTFFGASEKGYYADFRSTIESLMKSGINVHTIFDFPADAKTYPLVLLPSAVRMTDGEKAAAMAYLASGGVILATGACALDGCESRWRFPNRIPCKPEKFFPTLGEPAPFEEWMRVDFPECSEPNQWKNPAPGLYYNPHRAADGKVTAEMVERTRQKALTLPVEVVSADGYLMNMFRDGERVLVHLYAADFDTDIDHHLDEIRTHRSRVNLVIKAKPIDIARTVRVRTDRKLTVYVPFREEPVQIARSGDCYDITLPEDCFYAIFEVQ